MWPGQGGLLVHGHDRRHQGGPLTFEDLARSYLWKARSRRKTLPVLFDDGNYSDVVREGQEIVELCLKGAIWATIPRASTTLARRFWSGGANCQPTWPPPPTRWRGSRCGCARNAKSPSTGNLIPTNLYSVADANEAIRGVDLVIDFAVAVIAPD